MPIEGIGSYRSTAVAFRANWVRANAALAPAELKLTGGYDLAQFDLDTTALLAAIDAAGPLDLATADLSATREVRKKALINRVTLFRLSVASQLAGSTFAAAPIAAPNATAGFDVFCTPLREVAEQWARINALSSDDLAVHGAVGFVGPLLLQGGYTLANFQADVAALRTLWPEVENKTGEATFARDTRDALMKPFYERLKQYRLAVAAQLPADSPVVADLPRLTPPAGETPPGAGATGVWDPALTLARFSLAATDNPKVAYRSLRVTPGPRYSNENEITVSRIENNQTEATTLEGLASPGAVACFKIYSVGPEGNENGGKAMKIVRPVE